MNNAFTKLMGFVFAFILLSMVLGCGRGDGKDASLQRHGVITMAPHLTETAFALGQGSKIVAVGSFDDYPPEIASLPKVGGYIDTNFEKISALNPELIIAPGKAKSLSDFAAARGLRILNVNMDSMETIEAGVCSIGDALGCSGEARALWRKIAGELDAVREAVKGLPRPKTLIITMRESHDLNTLYTAGRSSFVSELVDCAGGENIYADSAMNYIEASKETIVMKAPEEIIEFHAGEKLDSEEAARYVADWSQLPSLPAMKNGRIHLIPESHSMRPGPRVGEIARILAKLLHPEAAIPTP